MRLFAKIDNSVNNLDRPFYFGSPFDRKWYYSYPTLSRYPAMMEETLAHDPTIRSEYENGLIKSRPRFTTLKSKWRLVYTYITSADKVLLKTLQTNVLVGSAKFKWTNPDDDTNYWVRFAAPLEFKQEPTDLTKYKIEFELMEA